MSISTSAGIIFSIGTALAVAQYADDAAAITALSALTYAPVGEIEDAGEIGDEAATQTFTALNNRRVRKVKTTFDAGTQSLTLGLDRTDAGQLAMKAALKSDDNFAFKIEYPDGETDYYVGQVTAFRDQIGSADSIRKATASVAINSAVFTDVA